MGLGLIEQRPLKAHQGRIDLIDAAAQPQAQVGADLVVAGAAGVQLLAQGAEQGDQAPLDGEVHVLVLEAGIERAGSRLGPNLLQAHHQLLGLLSREHAGRSRNDQVGTDLRLWLRRRIAEIDAALVRFERALLDQAEAHPEVMIPGYTHLQRAQPIALAHHLLAYVEMAERDRARLRDLRQRVNICPLGAAALAGTPVPIDRRHTAAALGFDDVYANSLDAVSDRDFAVEFSAAASLVMVHLSRLSEEVILWASEEFRFVTLTDRCATGSSLMPQKKNPDVPELVRGKCGRVFGHLQGLLVMIKGLPLAYNKDFQEDKEALFDTVATTLACLEAMAILLEEGLQFQPQRLEQAVGSDFSNATDVADYLVAKGVPFREAYQLVGGLVKTCLQEGILLRELPLERWQALHPSFEGDIYGAIAPRQVVAARRSEGGTAFEQVRLQLQRAQDRLSGLVLGS